MKFFILITTILLSASAFANPDAQLLACQHLADSYAKKMSEVLHPNEETKLVRPTGYKTDSFLVYVGNDSKSFEDMYAVVYGFKKWDHVPENMPCRIYNITVTPNINSH
jgi:hypothetical protein